MAENEVVDDESLKHPALDIGDLALSCPPFTIGPSSFTFTDDEDLRVTGHQSVWLCKTVNISPLKTFSHQLCAEWATAAVPVVPCHHLNQYVDTFNAEGLHSTFNLSLGKRKWKSKEHTWGRICGIPHVFFRELCGLIFFHVRWIPAPCLKTYLGFHLAHFQAV